MGFGYMHEHAQFETGKPCITSKILVTLHLTLSISIREKTDITFARTHPELPGTWTTRERYASMNARLSLPSVSSFSSFGAVPDYRLELGTAINRLVPSDGEW